MSDCGLPGRKFKDVAQLLLKVSIVATTTYAKRFRNIQSCKCTYFDGLIHDDQQITH